MRFYKYNGIIYSIGDRQASRKANERVDYDEYKARAARPDGATSSPARLHRYQPGMKDVAFCSDDLTQRGW
ncbi:hypothetical protein GCM10007159_07460 [Modicisalibacter luteus]|nr:hypothetical protein GCM10007159_07460 [Halomonas lutea]